ncbi:MAG: 1-acyl-sn-glycerol-3-phosphate acyltransferase [bacterium]|nr:1-acyl-sn-glycerol-3-phosphate acyltransferase [bacterium]MCP5068307.1 1-acyl-sn-glycerol-3-phosphate acyltransferase [bacterium]
MPAPWNSNSPRPTRYSLGVVRRLGSVVFWAFLTISSILLFPVAVLLWASTVLVDKRLFLLHKLTCFWASLYTWVNPVWQVSIEGREKIRRDETYVMVSNHLSTIDIFVVFRLFTHFKWISKIENFRLPFIGWNMRLNRYIELRRGERASVMQMFRACEQTLADGNSIMMFPEGTRSVDGKLRPFKPGAFELAIRCQKPLLVMTIDGSGDALPKRGFVLRGRHRIRMSVLGEIPVEELGDDEEALSDRVRAQMAEHLGQFIRA